MTANLHCISQQDWKYRAATVFGMFSRLAPWTPMSEPGELLAAVLAVPGIPAEPLPKLLAPAVS